MSLSCATEVRKSARRVDAVLIEDGIYQVHHEWIERLVNKEEEPFWICDTDVMFHSRVEDWEFEGAMAGRLIPEFRCGFARRITHARLHTALMWLDPVEIKKRIADVDAITPNHPFKTPIPCFAPLYYSRRESLLQPPEHYFFDTCAQLYHCIGGQKFSDEQLDAYSHLNCGTYLDLVESTYPGLRQRFEQMQKDPKSAIGLWKIQDQFYKKMAPR